MTLLRRTLALSLAAGAALAAAASGCRRADVTEAPNDIPPGWSLVPGEVHLARSSVQAIVVPQSVRAGVPFTITINTFGSGSCTRAHGDQVQSKVQVVDVTPLNWEAPAGTACTKDLRLFPHPVTLTLSQPGDATIRVHARDPQGVPFTADLPVRVEP